MQNTSAMDAKRTAPNSLRESFAPIGGDARRLFTRVAEAIDEIHDTDGIAHYQFGVADLGEEEAVHAQGVFIVVNEFARYPHIGAIHEVGHALDGVFLNSAQRVGSIQAPDARYGSDLANAGSAMLLGDWLAAVRRTSVYRQLDFLRVAASPGSPAEAEAMYYLRPRELWARCYEQFVARRTQDRSIQREMALQCKERVTIGGKWLYTYWDDQEFADIEAEMAAVFESLGWM